MPKSKKKQRVQSEDEEEDVLKVRRKEEEKTKSRSKKKQLSKTESESEEEMEAEKDEREKPKSHTVKASKQSSQFISKEMVPLSSSTNQVENFQVKKQLEIIANTLQELLKVLQENHKSSYDHLEKVWKSMKSMFNDPSQQTWWEVQKFTPFR
jgi:hypothetical protein